FLRHARSRMVGQVSRAPHRGPARRATDPEVAQSRRAGGWKANADRAGHGPGRKHQPALGQRLSPLRVRTLGPAVEEEAAARKRVQAKLKELKMELRRRMHQTIPEQGAYLRSVVTGHVRYFGVPLNGWAIVAFRQSVGRLWRRTLRRRSQKHRLTAQRFHRYM